MPSRLTEIPRNRKQKPRQSPPPKLPPRPANPRRSRLPSPQRRDDVGMVCPICNKPVDQPPEGQASSYPFCSERCRLIDLGRWLAGKYQIPTIDDDKSRVDSLEPPGAR